MTFIKNKKVKRIDDIDVNKILSSKKEPDGTKNSFKYFIGHNDDDVIRPLRIRLPKMTDMLENLMKMSFRVNDKQLLKNYDKIWEKI